MSIYRNVSPTVPRSKARRAILPSLAMAVVGTLLIGSFAPTATATTSSTRLSSADITVKEGKSEVISGQVPTEFAGGLVYLEITDKRRVRTEAGSAIADKNGNVKVKVHLGGGGTHKAQWRVVRNGKTQWTSKAFTITVTESGKKHKHLDSATLGMQHAEGKKSLNSNTKLRLKTRDGEVASDAGAVASDAVKDSGDLLSDFGGAMSSNVFSAVFNTVLGLIFPPPAAATAAQVQALANQVTQVQNTLNVMETNLDELTGTVSDLQSQVTQANAGAQAASCNVVLSEANGYVETITNYYDDYQTIYDPAWVSANLTGVSGNQGIKIVGEQTFGSGSGNPSFSSGVVQLQTATTGLANLLSENGAIGTSGILSTCASAFSAQVSAQNSSNTPGTVVALGSVEQAYYKKLHSVILYYTGWANLGQSVAAGGGYIAALSLNNVSNPSDASTFCNGKTPAPGSFLTCAGVLYNIAQTSNSTSTVWKSTGASWSDVTGGQLLGDARVDKTSNFIQPAQAAWVSDIAQFGTTIGAEQPAISTTVPDGNWESDFVDQTLGGMKFTTISNPNNGIGIQVTNIPTWYNQVQASVFASPTNNYQGSNTYYSTYYTRVNGGESMTIWVGPVGQYTVLLNVNNQDVISSWSGTVNVTPESMKVVTTVLGSAPLSSLSTGAGPASGVTSLSNPTWLLGSTFGGAKTSNWQWAFPLGTQTCASGTDCSVSQNMGQIMGNSGLRNYGATPNNLLLYTGETGGFNVDNDTAVGGLTSSLNNNPFWTTGNSSNPAFTNQTATSSSFVDVNTKPLAGSNVVITPPSSTPGNNLAATYIMNSYSSDTSWVKPYFINCTNNCQGNWVEGVQGGVFVSGNPTAGINYSYTQTLNANPSVGFTNNTAFYTPYTQKNLFNFNYPTYIGDGDGRTNVVQSLQTSVSSLPAFMSGTNNPGFQNRTSPTQYLWPVLNVNPNNGTVPCTMTSFTEGADGNAGVGNVCQKYYNVWLASALGVTTGPVDVSAGLRQGTLTPAGNNAVNLNINNTSGSPQSYTMVTSVSSGDAKLGSVVNAASTGGNNATITDCSNYNADLQCTLTVQSGNTSLNIPLNDYSNTSSFDVVMTQQSDSNTINATSAAATITPTAASAAVLPGAVTDLNVTMDSSNDTLMSISWVVPPSDLPISGYSITTIDPSGKESTTKISSTRTPGQTAQYNLPMSASDSGLWTISVAAINAGGAGPNTTTTATLGNSIPSSPDDVTATEKNGTIVLAWDVVNASPPLSNYTVTINKPDGKGGTVTDTEIVNLPGYTIRTVDAIGQWSFSVQASNSQGSSSKSSVNLNVTGTVPTQPRDVDVDVSETGWITASFKASVSVPVATNYYVALYAPMASQPTASVKIEVDGYTDQIRLRDFWQLGSNSLVGTWTVRVTPSYVLSKVDASGATNKVEVSGDFGAGSLYVSTQHLQNVGNRSETQLFLQTYPTLLIQQAANACVGDYWNAGYQVFGNCVDRTFSVDSRIPLPDGGKTTYIPTNVKASNVTSTGLNISWSPPSPLPPSGSSDPGAIVSYLVWINHIYAWVPDQSTTTRFLGSLASDKPQFIEVQAVHASGKVSLIASLTVNTLPAPPPPVG